jgi:glucose-6-phosphate isomerase
VKSTLTRTPPESSSPALSALTQHAAEAHSWALGDLFKQDARRAQAFSIEAGGLLLDFSKNHLRHDTLNLLADFARERGVETLRDAMLAGERINTTEHRAALHTCLRQAPNTSFLFDGHDITADIQAVLSRMSSFAEKIRDGSWKGYSGQRITDIVNIGIGGSDLGPAMTCAALRTYAHPDLRLHFLSNVDGHAADALLSALNPQTTLFIVASKTFTTMETMRNAAAARTWLLQHAQPADLAKHFVAVSTNTEAVREFGIDPVNMFPFWDWVGGRYSIWSAIGLPLLIAIGIEHFREFLAGAHRMDEHFRTATLSSNMPVVLALTGFWYRQFFSTTSQLIAPYHQDLHLFPAYLQQLEMESNGKQVTRDGKPVAMPTAPVTWGSVGTNGQHAYFQLLHQGTDLIPVDFIIALKPAHPYQDQHKALLANAVAQAEALMCGSGSDATLPAHRVFTGNRPSNMLVLPALDPAALGALIALYEHKTFVQGVLWNINSFDQWGVELGKTLAHRILDELNDAAPVTAHDSSTANLINHIQNALKP